MREPVEEEMSLKSLALLACDGHHLTAPHPEGRGLDAAIQAALAQAGIASRQIAFVNAHGTATQDNDRAEGKVLARRFGSDVVCLSTKGYTGHAPARPARSKRSSRSWVCEKHGFRQPASRRRDEDVAVAPVSERTGIDGDYALSTSLAFGGNNAALVIGEARVNQPMGILGIGAVTPLGRDVTEIAGQFRDRGGNPPHGVRANEELLADPAISRPCAERIGSRGWRFRRDGRVEAGGACV